MSSSNPSESLSFDINEIDEKIKKDGLYINKIQNFSQKIKFLPNIQPDYLEQKESQKIPFPKYFCSINTKEFDYIGILTNELKRDLYGYSSIDKKSEFKNDEFLGEYKNEIRDGFGIYKFSPSEERQEIYIGQYTNNKKEGKGMYIKINKSIKDDSNGNFILFDFESNLGTFKDDMLLKGIIFSVKDNKERLYYGKINELGEQEDNEALFIEDKNKIFKGKITKGNMVEGRNIFVNDKYEKIKGYYFNIIKNENNGEGYEFDSNKNEENDKECIEKLKNFVEKNYAKKIQEIYEAVNNSFNLFKNFEKAINVDFENEIKNKIRNELEEIIMD